MFCPLDHLRLCEAPTSYLPFLDPPKYLELRTSCGGLKDVMAQSTLFPLDMLKRAAEGIRPWETYRLTDMVVRAGRPGAVAAVPVGPHRRRGVALHLPAPPVCHLPRDASPCVRPPCTD
jgi:hypothetical protein